MADGRRYLLRVVVLAFILIGNSAMTMEKAWAQKGGGSLPPTSIVTPLLSNAVINSITNAGGVSTINCDIANCGLTAGGPAVNLGEGLPVGCADLTADIIATSGNTAEIASSTCVALNGPYRDQLGQVGTPLAFKNAASSSTSYSQITQTADGHTALKVYHSGALQSQLDLQSTGAAGIGNRAANLSSGMGTDGLYCVGQPFANMGGSCSTTGYNNEGYASLYKGLQVAGGNTSQPFIVYSAENAGPFTGSQTFGSLVTCPASGYGADWMYEIKVYALEMNAAPGATLQMQVNYTDEFGPQMQNSGTPMAMALAGAKLPWSTTFTCAPSQTIGIQTITTNVPTYRLSVTIEVH